MADGTTRSESEDREPLFFEKPPQTPPPQTPPPPQTSAPPQAQRVFGSWREKLRTDVVRRQAADRIAALFAAENAPKIVLIEGASGQGKTWLLTDIRDALLAADPDSRHYYRECEDRETPPEELGKLFFPGVAGAPPPQRRYFAEKLDIPGLVGDVFRTAGPMHYLYLDDLDKQLRADDLPPLFAVLVEKIVAVDAALRLIVVGKTEALAAALLSCLGTANQGLLHRQTIEAFDDATADAWFAKNLPGLPVTVREAIKTYRDPEREIENVYRRFPIYLHLLRQQLASEAALADFVRTAEAGGDGARAALSIRRLLDDYSAERFHRIVPENRDRCLRTARTLAALSFFEDQRGVPETLAGILRSGDAADPIPDEETAHGVQTLRTVGILQPAPPGAGAAGGLFFYHDVIRKHVYEGMTADEREHIHRQAADWYGAKPDEESREYRIWHLARVGTAAASGEAARLLSTLARKMHRDLRYRDEVRLRETLRGKLRVKRADGTTDSTLEWINLADLAEAYYNIAPDSDKETALLSRIKREVREELPNGLETLMDRPETLPVFAQVRASEAIYLYEDGDIAEATRLARKLVADLAGRDEDALLANALSNLGICYYKQMRYAAADQPKEPLPDIGITDLAVTARDCFRLADDLLDFDLRKKLQRSGRIGEEQEALEKDLLRITLHAAHTAEFCVLPSPGQTVRPTEMRDALERRLRRALEREHYSQEFVYAAVQMAYYALCDGDAPKLNEWLKIAQDADAVLFAKIASQRRGDDTDAAAVEEPTIDPWTRAYIHLLNGYAALLDAEPGGGSRARERFNTAFAAFVELGYRRDILFAQYAITASYIWTEADVRQLPPTAADLIRQRLQEHVVVAEKIGEMVARAVFATAAEALGSASPLPSVSEKRRIAALFGGLLRIGRPALCAAFLIFRASPLAPTLREIEAP